MADFLKAFNETIVTNEGKYSNDANDSGGVTIYGLTQKDDADWQGWDIVKRYNFNSALLPYSQLLEVAKPYYKSKYWDYAQLDKFPNQDLAKKIFSVSVNMGKFWAISFLQRSLNVLNHNGKDYPDLKVDGIFGANTLNAVLSCQNLANVLEAVRDLQGQRYIAIAESNPTQEDFANGWFNRIRDEG